MTYFIRRGDQEYGPYTMADLERYAAAGNVSPDDAVRLEASDQFQRLSDILPRVPAGYSTGVAIPPGAYLPAYQKPTMANGAPLPPDFHWGLLLLLHFPTCGIITLVWIFLQAWWVKQIDSSSRAIWFLAGYLGISYVIGIPASIMMNLLDQHTPIQSQAIFWIGLILVFSASVGSAVLFLIAVFSMRRSMLHYFNQTENIGLTLSGVMTFFFPLWYFQFHMSRIAKWKKTGILE